MEEKLYVLKDLIVKEAPTFKNILNFEKYINVIKEKKELKKMFKKRYTF